MEGVAEVRAGEVRAGQEQVGVGEVVIEKAGQAEVVEREVVVTAKELRADRERREEEAGKRGESEKAEKGLVKEEGLDDVEKKTDDERASVETERLGSDKGTEVICEEEHRTKEDEKVESDCVYVTKEDVEEAQVGGKETVERAERRRRIFSKRLAKVMASGEVAVKVEKVDGIEIDPSSEEEEEKKKIHLSSRTRAGRATDQVAPATEGPEELSTTSPSTEVVPPAPDDQAAPITPMEEEEIQDEKTATPQADQEAPEKPPTEKEAPEEGEGETDTDE